jgi:hypothetical protein
MENTFFRTLLDHALISLVPGTLGALVGIGLARLINKLLLSRPKMPAVGAANWIPWRGFLVALLVFLLTNAFPAIWLGIGVFAAGLTILIATIVFSFAIAACADRNSLRDYPTRRYISAFRTALAASVGFGMFGAFYGAGGAGFLIQRGSNLLEYDLLWKGYGVVAVLAILADLFVGFVDWLILINNDANNKAS